MSKLLNVCKKIESIISPLNKKNLEIEVKFRKVTYKEFIFLLNYLKNLYAMKEETTTDYYIKNKRITEKEGKFYETTKKNWSEPFYIFQEKRELKFNVATEEMKLLKNKSVKKYDFKRIKERKSFEVRNFSVDLTKVIREGIESYEVEIEVIDPEIYNASDFSDFILEYIGNFGEEETDIISFCNYCLSGEKSTDSEEIDYKYISKPRDLLKNDITAPNSILKGFAVSIKADGVQFFLVFYEGNISLVSSKGEVTELCPIEEEYSHLENSIFVGELVEREKLKKQSITDFMSIFLPFDTICFKGEIVAYSEDYLSRFENTRSLEDLEIICSNVKKIKIFEKKIYNLGKNSNTFYKGFKECYLSKKTIVYKEDGYIFTPIDSPYLCEGQSKNKRERILSRYYDVCKFKKVEKRSIDFLVKDKKIYAYSKRTRSLQNYTKIKFSLDFSEDLDDKIVEFFPFFSGKEVSLMPSRLRSDKSFPNEMDTVDEIVRSYTEPNPITEDTLLGKDTTLMRAFNNFFIKGRLIQDMEGYVIDIGAGNGGDISKFGSNEKIKRVLSVEPNLSFSDEFSRRLKNSKYNNKFHLLRGVKGEEKSKIIEGMNYFFPKNMRGQRLSISFMISLSFFWSSEENLLKLADTINSINAEYKNRNGTENLRIIFYTIDGYRVEEYFSKIGKNKITLNTITLSFNGENQVEVDIKDSKTVSKQTEYLVKLDQLFDLIGGELIENRSPRVSNILMSEGELSYLSLFTYGLCSVTKEIQIVYSEERIQIDEEIGIEEHGVVLAMGEDTIKKIPYLGKNIYRVGTLDQGDSLLHSILKLTNEKYRSEDVYGRIQKVEEFKETFKDLESLPEIIGKRIKVINSNDDVDYYGESEETINLYVCKDGSYEPLVMLVDEEVFYTVNI